MDAGNPWRLEFRDASLCYGVRPYSEVMIVYFGYLELRMNERYESCSPNKSRLSWTPHSHSDARNRGHMMRRRA
jgi:hypothetical protein